MIQAQVYIYAGAAFVTGFIFAWIIRSISIAKIRKELKSTSGYLESEKLKKETLQKEISTTHQMKQATEGELNKKLKEYSELNRMLDQDILLLQKSNEETEALLLAGQPAVYELKLKLIEAYNSIARYKALAELKESDL